MEGYYFPPAGSVVRQKSAAILLVMSVALVVATFVFIVTDMNKRAAKANHSLDVIQARLSQRGAVAPDPDAFQEARDGNNALSLEDVNGDSEIWEDTRSGTRLFCHATSPCIVLPSVRPGK